MIIVTALAVALIAGIAIGATTLVCLGIKREESERSIQDEPPTRAARATRRLVGWHGTAPMLVIGPGNVARWADRPVGR